MTLKEIRIAPNFYAAIVQPVNYRDYHVQSSINYKLGIKVFNNKESAGQYLDMIVALYTYEQDNTDVGRNER